LYHSRNINDIRGRRYELIVCAGARAEKWKANQDPETDRGNLQVLCDALQDAHAHKLLLISTVDVYPVPIGVDEETPIDCARATADSRVSQPCIQPLPDPAGRTHSRSTVRFPLTACDATRWRRWLPLPQGSAGGRPVPIRGCGKAEGCGMKLAVSNLAWPVESD